LECLGHGVKIDGKKTVKKLLDGKPGGGGGREKRRLRWMVDVGLGLKNMGVKELRIRALDRTEWVSLIREAKAKLRRRRRRRRERRRRMMMIIIIIIIIIISPPAPMCLHIVYIYL
jgi:hypothetical protein